MTINLIHIEAQAFVDNIAPEDKPLLADLLIEYASDSSLSEEFHRRWYGGN